MTQLSQKESVSVRAGLNDHANADALRQAFLKRWRGDPKIQMV